jgi:hypothetical protein
VREFVSDSRVADYVCQRTGIQLGTAWTALGIVQNGQVTAGFVFTHYTGPDIHVTVAMEPGALTKTFLARLYHYAAAELSCTRVSITTEQLQVVKMALRMGAEIEGIKRDAFGPGRNATMLGLLVKDWPFVKRTGSDPIHSRCNMNAIRSRDARP